MIPSPVSGEGKRETQRVGGEPRGLVPAAICNTSVLQCKPTTADGGKRKTKRGQGKNSILERRKVALPTCFCCHRTAKLQETYDSLWSRREKDRLGRSGQAKTEAVLCHLRRLQTGATSPSSARLHWEGTE